MEGADQNVLGRAANQPLGPFAHLGGGLVGEGDGGNPFGGQPGLDQAADLVRDDPRLARARPGQHQARPAQEMDSFKLGEVKTGGHRGRRDQTEHRWQPMIAGAVLLSVLVSSDARYNVDLYSILFFNISK